MARGDDRIEQTAQAAQEARERWADQNVPQLWLKGGEEATVRFCEQGPDKRNFAVHEYTVPNPNNPSKPFRRFFTCLDDSEDGTPCPGCQGGMKRKIKGVYNVIQRNRPVLRKGQDGKALRVNGEFIIDGHQDEIVILTVASTTADMIRKKDAEVNGLMSRDLLLSKSGTQFQPFVLSVPDIDAGPQPMSDADQVLLQKKHDLEAFMAPPSFQEAATLVAQYAGQGVAAQAQAQQSGSANGGDGQAQASDPENPFLDERKQ